MSFNPIEKTGIGKLLDKVTVALASPPTFALPRTAEITDAAEVARYDAILLDVIAGRRLKSLVGRGRR